MLTTSVARAYRALGARLLGSSSSTLNVWSFLEPLGGALVVFADFVAFVVALSFRES